MKDYEIDGVTMRLGETAKENWQLIGESKNDHMCPFEHKKNIVSESGKMCLGVPNLYCSKVGHIRIIEIRVKRGTFQILDPKMASLAVISNINEIHACINLT